MYSMKETCKKVHLNYQTLKYYCNEGLIPNVKRDSNNYRVFDENDIAWILGLKCLKKCGMSIKKMKNYMNLCLMGQSSIPERKEILKETRENLLIQLKEIENSIHYIDTKQQFYDDILAGKKEYFSYIKK